MIQTKTRTLQLEFADAAGNSVVYSLKNPKEGLDKGTVDAAVSTLLEKKIFATAEGELTALKDSRIITRQVMVGGKPAHTDFTCLAAGDAYSLVSVCLHTGRTHQIRVHSAYLGYPLVGDDLYGGSRALMTRQALHAYAMQFVHPMTGQLISVNSPLPADMARLVSQAGWNYIYARLH